MSSRSPPRPAVQTQRPIMDRVTRYPILSLPFPHRLGGLALDGDAGYRYRLVDVGPEAEPALWDEGGDPEPALARGGREEPAVDTEQIDFAAARRQFLCLERAGSGSPRSPGVPERRAREEAYRPGLDSGLGAGQPFWEQGAVRIGLSRGPGAGQVSCEQEARGPGLSNELGVGQPFWEQGAWKRDVANGWGAGERGAHPPGVSRGAGAGQPFREQGTCREGASNGWGEQGARGPGPEREEQADAPDSEAERPGETPIEREIRRAQEREAALRAQRGLERAGRGQELVRIPARPLLSGPSAPAPARRAPGRPSLCVQRDLARGRGPGAASPDGPRRAASFDALRDPEPDPRAVPPAGLLGRGLFVLRVPRFSVRDASPGPGRGRLSRARSTELLRREVDEVLRREQEVAAERRRALCPERPGPAPDGPDGVDDDSRCSSRASGTSGSYWVSGSPVGSPTHQHSGLAWSEDSEDAAVSWPRRKEQTYAGISPSDYVNSQILEATRVGRHKSLLAQRWEAGLHASEDED